MGDGADESVSECEFAIAKQVLNTLQSGILKTEVVEINNSDFGWPVFSSIL